MKNGIADRWYRKGIHVPVNRFGSEENKKIETGCKPDERCHRQTSLFTARG